MVCSGVAGKVSEGSAAAIPGIQVATIRRSGVPQANCPVHQAMRLTYSLDLADCPKYAGWRGEFAHRWVLRRMPLGVNRPA